MSNCYVTFTPLHLILLSVRLIFYQSICTYNFTKNFKFTKIENESRLPSFKPYHDRTEARVDVYKYETIRKKLIRLHIPIKMLTKINFVQNLII